MKRFVSLKSGAGKSDNYTVINHRNFDLFRQNLDTGIKKLAAVLFVAISYYVTARLGLFFSTESQVSIIWPATGVGISIILIFGLTYWPALAFGALLANIQTGGPPLVILALTVTNTLEPLLASALINRMTNPLNGKKFGPYNSTFALITGIFACAGLSATLGVLSLCLGRIIEWNLFQQNWLTWFAANYLGGIILVPFLIIIFFNKTVFRIVDHIRFVTFLISGAGICGFLFFSSGGAVFLFFLFPFLLLSINFLSDLSSKFIVVLVSVMALLSTRFGFGQFQFEFTMPFLVHIQLLLIGISTASLFVSDFKRQGSLQTSAAALMAGWLISSLIFYVFHSADVRKKTDSFSELINNAVKSFQGQMNSNVVALRSGVGLFAASKTVERAEWKEFVTQLNLIENGSGILGLGVVFRVQAKNIPKFASEAKKEYSRPFAIYNLSGSKMPEGEAYIVTYIEPDSPNFPAVGLNMASESDRKAVVEEAMNSGTTAISKSVMLVQGTEKSLGLILVYPVFSRGSQPLTITERRARTFAWVYAPIKAQDFFDVTMSRENFRQINYSISEAATGREIAASPGFAKMQAGSVVKKEFLLANKKYTIFAKPTSDAFFVANSSSYIAGTVAVFLTLLLGAFVSYIQSEKYRSNILVKERTEQLMFERAKTLQASKLASLGEMSAAIAHEINNPLAIIQGSVELMTCFVHNPEKLTAKIQTVLRSTERISKIVNGLRKFSRSSDGYSYRENSLNEIAKEAINLVSVKSQRFSTAIICEFKTEAFIYCDMVEIEQVVVNLVSNGIDAVKENQEKWVKVEITEEGQFVVLKVIDSGTGISELNREKLFEPFFTTKPVGEGTGLGLSISKGILDDHGAAIALDVAAPNTTFVIRFRKAVASAT